MIAEERARADAAAGPPAGARPQPGQIVVYLCKWKDCNFQFETTDQLWEHITNCHTSQIGNNWVTVIRATSRNLLETDKPASFVEVTCFLVT